MNHLAHFALAGSEPGMLVGSFLGDYVKGRLKGDYPTEIEKGIRLHRAIDQFTDSHPVVRESALRFEPRYRRFTGIITDLAYDHILAQNWLDYYDEPLPDFSQRTLAKLLAHEQNLTEKAKLTAQRMHEYNSMAGYGEPAFLIRSLEHVSSRLSRKNPVAEAYPDCLALLPELSADLAAFYPELMKFCDEWKQVH